ncbi:MAG: phage holin family protein [Deltaproteobacteria bacterium]|nr:phage holin family protein [Deltaproteobacteria bacterium]MBK8239798.1 phage holin family protein [Deltaproteobacteria bacterium]MBK8714534.1 phage holin family protein [Deltaproteobacteria bacterium]MBP7289413.1 phage holin family protein [Nannocystaceae bacterium]
MSTTTTLREITTMAPRMTLQPSSGEPRALAAVDDRSAALVATATATDQLRSLVSDGADIVSSEIQLALLDMRAGLLRRVREGVGLGISGVIGATGAGLLVAAAVGGLAELLPIWAALAIVGATLVLTAVIVMSVLGRRSSSTDAAQAAK